MLVFNSGEALHQVQKGIVVLLRMEENEENIEVTKEKEKHGLPQDIYHP